VARKWTKTSLPGLASKAEDIHLRSARSLQAGGAGIKPWRAIVSLIFTGIRRYRAVHQCAYFPEKFRPEDPGREDTQHFRNLLRLIGKTVDNSAWDEKIVSGPDLDLFAGHRPVVLPARP
jgi:hypothetical protein